MEDDLKILQIECLSNHWSDILQIWNQNQKCSKWRQPPMEDDLNQRWKKRGPRGPWSRNLFPGFPQILWLYMRKVKKFTKMEMIAYNSVHKQGNFIVFVDYMSKKWICVKFFVLNWLTYINLGLFATNIICTFSAKKFWFKSGPAKFFAFSCFVYKINLVNSSHNLGWALKRLQLQHYFWLWLYWAAS